MEDGRALPYIPLEIQVDIFSHLHDISSSSFTTALRLSRAHHRILSPLLYRCISIQSHQALEGLAATLLNHSELAQHVRSFFFQGPQGRRRTGRDQLRYLRNRDDDDDEEDDDNSIEEDLLQHVGLESGIEGEGQEATWDEHESLMQLCTLILKLCSRYLTSIGFVDCVPWFLAPTEGGALNFTLPQCRDFTGVTVGLFGLLPHLQQSKKNIPSDVLEMTLLTTLERIHLVGGDFGSFALQRILLSSPSARTLTHLHITAPTLYRPEHHSHLVMHIVGLLQNLPKLRRISVGFLHWLPCPPIKKIEGNSKNTKHSAVNNTAQEVGGFSKAGYGPTEYDDRLIQCRQAYERALPEALQQSKRKNVTVAIIMLPFIEGTPVGFAGWILAHHTLDKRDKSEKRTTQQASRYWNRRELSLFPSDVASDGAPNHTIWQSKPVIEWIFDENDEVQPTRGQED